jgi:hypothetical protein
VEVKACWDLRLYFYSFSAITAESEVIMRRVMFVGVSSPKLLSRYEYFILEAYSKYS